MQAENLSVSEGTAGVARPILDRAEQADGNSPVSDQALLAAGQGQRALLVFTEAEGAARSPSGSWAKVSSTSSLTRRRAARA